MYETNTEYDRGVNTFSPEGRILQVEYAIKAVNMGSTVIGIRAKDGVVLAVEKKVESPLVESSSIKKMHKIDDHLCAATCGVISDARTLIEKARMEAQNHRFTYNEPLRAQSIAQSIGDTILGFGKGDDMPSRPFGVAILIAGCDDQGAHLFTADPAGTYTAWQARAIGSGAESAQNALTEEYNPEMKLKDAVNLAVKTLKSVMEEKVNKTNVEVATVTHGKDEKEMLSILGEEELDTIISAI